MGKNSHMRMEVQGRLMQARLIEIYQVFAKKKVGFFSSRVYLPEEDLQDLRKESEQFNPWLK